MDEQASRAEPAAGSAETIPPRPPSEVPSTPLVPFAALPCEFGRYRVEKLLGRGAMGAVYLAHDTQLGRPVAIKVPQMGGPGAVDITERLLREAKAAAILSHPNICRVYDAGVEAGTMFIAMEFIDGKPLSDFISPIHLQDQRKSANVVRKLAAALADAHAKGIIHRDIKPANILVNARGEPILTDFGLARLTDQPQDARSTQPGMLMGSPAYMSPEQARGDNEAVGRSSDIYSLGVVLFEMLTGRLPFRGSVMTILCQIIADEPPAATSFRPELDSRLDATCRRLMAKRPQDRFASMTDVANELANWLKGVPPQGAPAGAAATTHPAEPVKEAIGDLQPLPEKIVAAKTAEAKSPAAPAANELAQVQRRIEKLLDAQDFNKAIPLLAGLAATEGVPVQDVALWAKRELASANQKRQQLSQRMSAACQKSRDLLAAYQYAEMVHLLEPFPEAARSEEVRSLLAQASDAQEESLGLQQEIDESLKRKSYDRLEPLVQRFIKLKPGNRKMQRLAEDLARNHPARAVAHFQGTGKYFDVAGRLVEPRHAALGALALVALCLVASYSVWAHLAGNWGNTTAGPGETIPPEATNPDDKPRPGAGPKNDIAENADPQGNANDRPAEGQPETTPDDAPAGGVALVRDFTLLSPPRQIAPAANTDPNRHMETKLAPERPLGGQVAKDLPSPDLLLVGFEVTVGPMHNPVGGGKKKEFILVTSIKPIYRDRRKEFVIGKVTYGKAIGNTRRLVAPADYAVGAVTIRAGGHIDSLEVKFMRIKDGRLDANDAKTAKAGGPGGLAPVTLGDDGKPSVGCVVFHEPDGGLRGLGLIRRERWGDKSSLETAPAAAPASAKDEGGEGRTGQFKPVTNEELLSKVPKSFSFDLNERISDPESGKRIWTRPDDRTFVEHYPSGTENKLRILGRATVAGIEGTIVEKVGFERVQVFVPDRGSKKMEIKYRFVEKPDGWVLLGTMKKVE